MTTNVDVLVDRYLTDLEAELHDLPATRRREILDEVGEHIAEARAALDAETEATIRTVLERLGDPADIAAEARDRFGVPAQPASQATPWLEVAALVALLIPFLGWVVGLVLLWLSRTWTTREKAIATLLALGVGALGLAALSSPIEWLRPLLVIALTVPTVIYLGIRLRADAMPAAG
jgi:HAAS domain-containing protein